MQQFMPEELLHILGLFQITYTIYTFLNTFEVYDDVF
jgi:hypothetical protein